MNKYYTFHSPHHTSLASWSLIHCILLSFQFLAELQKLQSQVELRPSEEKLQAMVDSMDATFKRQLGENVIGLKLSVGQVLKLVQQKANKEDVLTLLSKRYASLSFTVMAILPSCCT